MVAGGRAMMDGSLPINGCHYEAAADREYPDMAYGLGAWTDASPHQPWPMAKDKPIFLSEEAYLHGRKPQDFAGLGGERCFAGRSETRAPGGLLLRMYSEGYRWQELAVSSTGAAVTIRNCTPPGSRSARWCANGRARWLRANPLPAPSWSGTIRATAIPSRCGGRLT